jgi:hypothetical protein
MVADLKRLYSAGDEPVVVVFDVFIPPNADIDMLVLKRDALIVVEMKRCEKAVRGGVNGAWEIVDGRVPPAELKGGSFGNPFLQVQEYSGNILRTERDGSWKSSRLRRFVFATPRRPGSTALLPLTRKFILTPTLVMSRRGGCASRV